MDALTTGYEIGNPKAGENTHLIDHTWLALVATAGLTFAENLFVRQAENWQVRILAEGESSESTVDFSQFERALSNHAGYTMIVGVEHTPGRMTSDEYAEGESVTILVADTIHASLKQLYSLFLTLGGVDESLVQGLTTTAGKVSTLESTVSDLTSRLEALEGSGGGV